jgi:hypothetical protein
MSDIDNDNEDPIIKNKFKIAFDDASDAFEYMVKVRDAYIQMLEEMDDACDNFNSALEHLNKLATEHPDVDFIDYNESTIELSWRDIKREFNFNECVHIEESVYRRENNDNDDDCSSTSSNETDDD